MGLFVNLAAGGFTLQSGAQNWLYYAWMDFLFRVCGTYTFFLLPTDGLNGSSCAPRCACVSVGVCGWVGDRGFVSHCSFFHFPSCGTQLASTELELRPFPLSRPH